MTLVDEDLELSTREHVKNLNIFDYLLYPYHIQRVHFLLASDVFFTVEICQWFFQKVYENPLFDTGILLTDETQSKTSTRIIFGPKKTHMQSWNPIIRSSFPLMCRLEYAEII